MKRIQLGSQNIEITSSLILDLDIISDHPVNLNLLNAPVNTQTMSFMNYKISNRKFCKILNALSIIILFLFSLFLLMAENIRFCHDHKLGQGILKSLFRMAIDHHDLSRLNLPVIILTVESRKLVFLKVLCQTLCPGPGAGKKRNPVSLSFVLFQILCQKLKAAVIRIYRLGLYIKFFIDLPAGLSGLQCTEGNTISLVQLLLHLFKRTEPVFRKIILSLFCSVQTALAIFLLHSLSLFHKTIWFIQKNHRFLRRKIIQKRKLCLLPRMLHSRINCDLLQIFQRTLALRVKAADRINLISPQLNSPGILLCQTINIYNTATNGKLPRQLYLSYPFIAQTDQPGFQSIYIHSAVTGKMQKLFPYLLQRFQKIHTAINTGNNSQLLFLHKRTDHLHSLADQQIPVNVCLKEKQIPGRI